MNKALAILSAVALTAVTALANPNPRHVDAAQGNAGGPPPERQAFGHYLLIQNALAGDSLKGVPEAAAAVTQAVRSDPDKKLPALIAEQAENVGKAKDLAAACAAFKGLSDALIAYRKSDKALAEQFYVIHCSMAFDNQGASWLQATKTVSNPYFGSSMLRCGVIKN